MRKLTLLAGLILAVSTSAFAEEVKRVSPKERFQEFQENRFEAKKDHESASHQARIEILNHAENCIQNAPNPEAYRACEAKEREAREQLREQNQLRVEEHKEHMEQFKDAHPEAVEKMQNRRERVKERRSN